jgi:DNA-binding MarR family transcriptional regulator
VIAGVAAEGKAAGFPPMEWYDVLWELESNPKQGLRPFELERGLLLQQYNLSRLIDRMCRAGYVEKRPCEEDGRGQVLVVTEKGRALRKRMWPAYLAAIRKHVGSHLSEAQARTLCRLLIGMVPDRGPPQESERAGASRG